MSKQRKAPALHSPHPTEKKRNPQLQNLKHEAREISEKNVTENPGTGASKPSGKKLPPAREEE